MRQSKRTLILDAAVQVVQRAGIAAVTFDSVAAQAELTKGGLLYHFRSREALLEAVHEHLAHQWESQLEQAAGATADHAGPRERSAAYAAVCAASATRAELLLMVEAASDPVLSAYGQEVQNRWVPSPDSAELPQADLEDFVLRLAADGLWLHESIGGRPLDPRLRRQVADYLTAALSDPPGTDRPTG